MRIKRYCYCTVYSRKQSSKNHRVRVIPAQDAQDFIKNVYANERDDRPCQYTRARTPESL